MNLFIYNFFKRSLNAKAFSVNQPLSDDENRVAGTVYLLGGLFMVLFPPRNFNMSGAKLRTERFVNDSLVFKEYLNYNKMLSTMKDFAKNYPEVVEYKELRPAKTHKRRTIYAIELRMDKQSKKPGIFIVGGLDGMAWGSPNAILELSQKLVYDVSYQTPFLNDYDWYFIPMANPDGIEFTQQERSKPDMDAAQWPNYPARDSKRPTVWHKNLESDVKNTKCFGININRNFAYHWKDDSSAAVACSQFYPAQRPFSTAESKAIRQYVDDLGIQNISLAIHLHASYITRKEYILYPWRYTRHRQPSNFKTLQEIGEYAARKARLSDGRIYEVHQGSKDEIATGTMCDYIAGVVGVDLVFLIRPYHPRYPNLNDSKVLTDYIRKSTASILSIVRGWRSSTKLNTLHFFGKEIEY